MPRQIQLDNRWSVVDRGEKIVKLNEKFHFIQFDFDEYFRMLFKHTNLLTLLVNRINELQKDSSAFKENMIQFELWQTYKKNHPCQGFSTDDQLRAYLLKITFYYKQK